VTTPVSHHDVARSGVAAALQLGTRTVLTRLVAFGGTFVLARILAPADFGVYAFVWFVIVVFLALGDGGLSASLVQRRREPTEVELGTAFTLQVAIGVAGLAVVWVLAPAAAQLLPERRDSSDLLRVLALGLPLVATRALGTAMLERNLQYGPIAVAEVAGQVAFYAVAIPLALSGWGAWSLVLGGVAHSIAPTAVILMAYAHVPRICIDAAAMRELFRFGGLYQTASLATWVRDAVVPFIGSVVAGPTVGGYLQFSWRIGQLLGSGEEIVGRVTFPAFSRLRDDSASLLRAVRTTSRLGVLISMPAAAWAIASAPIFVPAVFGEAWAPAVVIVQFIAFGIILRFPARVVRQAFFAVGAATRATAISVASLVLVVLPVTVLIPLADGAGAGVGFAIGSALTALLVIGGTGSISIRAIDLVRLVGEAATLVVAAWASVTVVGGATGLVVAGGVVLALWALFVVLVDRAALDAVLALRRARAPVRVE